ncbi:class I SAM-dependent methyltransferase [Rhizorhapis suberifaciens]|uniref:Putative methyltransferase n=1 Tax=Rhizorhapis suberifaciens TaxID=13656 RepID=A0A840HQA2_9SPHN|nr:class I SAM-dependent methyltransferase [Rhizorhapis suberifaciens]MBB4639744.1 putative methyltransferase [Rhizorhapis suberifaciens]
MCIRALLAIATLLCVAVPPLQAQIHHAQQDKAGDPIETAVALSDRSEANRARDKYRHPVETLKFFGVKPTDTIVEIWPGSGWYSEILGPFSKAQGKLYLAQPGRALESSRKLVTSNPALSHSVLSVFPNADGLMKVPDGVADVVLTFRNVHNWRFGGRHNAQLAFNQMFAMLKPNGILGVVDHRLPENMDDALQEKSGYIKRSEVIALAKDAGFELIGESDINANPKDTHDWPEGVWTLPPALKKGQVERDKYLAIGESDRMTLKFRRPAS